MCRIVSFVFALFLTFSNRASACPSPEISESFQKSIENIFSTSGVWPGYKPRTLKLAVGYGDLSKALLFNFSNEDLKPISNQVLSCGNQSKWSVIRLGKVPNPANGVYEPQMQNPNGAELQILASQIGAPILFINSTAKIGDVVFGSEEIARIAVHEIFHFSYQFSGKFRMDDGFERTFLDRCAKNKIWLDQVHDEFIRWRDILRDWDRLSNKDLINIITSTLRQRDTSKDVETSYCWNATRFWERIEGTAFYVETESAKKAKFATDVQVRNELSKYVDSRSQSVCTGCPDTGYGKINQSFFYGTGALISLAILRLSGTTLFQKDIEKGISPADVFLADFDKSGKRVFQKH